MRREAAADLIPRFDGNALALVPQRVREEPIVGGLVAGQAVLDVDGTGGLAGFSVLEQKKLWPKGAITWELPVPASPHVLRLLERDGGHAELRWDAARKLFAVVWSEAADELFALGPRAYAATAVTGSSACSRTSAASTGPEPPTPGTPARRNPRTSQAHPWRGSAGPTPRRSASTSPPSGRASCSVSSRWRSSSPPASTTS